MDKLSEEIITMEKAALRKWGNGDPSGFLEISAPDVVYFDPYVLNRIDGLNSLREYYQAMWGKIFFDRFELINPIVQVSGEMAVLTFNYISYKGEASDHWNCTEVYRRAENGWKIIQSHWSYTDVFKNKTFQQNA
jgi:ketosteroid isomerase-like protein